MVKISDVVSLLLGEAGYLEKKSNAQLDSKTANAGYNNYTKYTRDIDSAGINDARYQGQAWCCSLAIWPELHLAGAAEVQKRFHLPAASRCKAYNCEYLAGYFQSAGAWYDAPQAGDFIFFRTYNTNGTVRYRYAHVGRVVAVENGRVYTVEGNTSTGAGVEPNGGGVWKKSYALTSRSIVGYGRPQWQAGEEDAPAAPEKEETVEMNVRMLRKGMKGEDVRTLQAALMARGFDCGKAGADGDFGAGTDAALRQFQTKYALGADGIAGKGTWGKLLGA